tara:strand:+ start:260 stop:670 length:411 start_codon:yes stop_codon:yes gene_type:complete
MEHTASKLKYIGIWFLWYLITFVSAFVIFFVIGFFGFYKECDIFFENFTTVFVYGISAMSFIFVYSKFKDVNVRRVVPYLWILGVIGAGGMYQDVKVTLQICNLDSGSAAVFILGGMTIHNLYIQNHFKKTSQYIN